MTAPVITLTAAEAEAIDRANAALAWVGSDDFPWPGNSGEIKMYRDNLRDCLSDHADLTASPPEHPATLFPDLGHGQDNAMEIALDRVTGDIRELAGVLEILANAAEEAARAREEREAA